MLSALLGIAVALLAPTAGMRPQTAPATPLSTPQFRRYGLADGLPGAVIYAVTQDHDGYMWFGTTSGLARYDGVSFKVFRHDVNDPNSLPNNQIYTLFVDRAGQLWIGSVSNGLSRYDPATGGFVQWRHADADPASLSHDEVWSISQTSDGALWVATQAGLDRMHADGRGFDHLLNEVHARRLGAPDAEEGMGPTRALLAEPDGKLWIGAEQGIFLRAPGKRLQRIHVAPGSRADLSHIWRIEGGGNDVRVATSQGLLAIGADRIARSASAQLDGVRVMSSQRDARGRLWVGTKQGVWLDAGSGHFQAFYGHPLLPGGFPAEWVWQIGKDREGGLWFVVAGAGAVYLGPGWDGFARFTHVPDEPSSLTTTAAEVVQASRDNQLWVGEMGAVDKLDPATGRVQHVVTNLPQSVLSLAEDTHGRLWIAGEGALYVLDNGRLQRLETQAAGLTRPTRLVAAGDGRIVVASWGEGLFAIDPDTRAISPLRMVADTGDALSVSVLLTHDGAPWYASAAGLMRWDAPTRRMVFVNGVPRRYVVGIAFDRSGFWIAWEDGLQHFRYAASRAVVDRVVHVPPNWQGIDVLGIRTDRMGQLWLFATQGLWRYDAATDRFASFGPQDGLLEGQFNNDTSAMLADGMIYAAAKGGVVGFSPERLAGQRPATIAPKVVLSAVTIHRSNSDERLSFDAAAPLRLGWRDDDLKIEARMSSFVNPAANRFRFRLQGLDPGWVDVGMHGQREFAGLGAGDYQLDVMAAGPAGVWGRLAQPLVIQVQAPPWQRWWAWLIYALALAVLAWACLRIWQRRLRHRHAIQLAEQRSHLAEQASAAKTQFLATLSHEIRTPMTGVMGMAELLLTTSLDATQRGYTHAMQRSGTMLLKLLNETLDLARIEAGRLELEMAPFDPRQLVAEVAQLEQGLAQAKGLRLDLELSEQLPALLLGDVMRIKQVLLNLTSNAMKFTEHGSVTLRVALVTDGVKFSVQDTGPGIAEASQARLFQRFEQVAGPQRHSGSGLGLAICRELVGLMEGSIELESRMGFGSTFHVRLPLDEVIDITPAAAPHVATNGGAIYSVLLVEDDEIVAAVIHGLLERQGHRITYVGNGLAALAEISQSAFDVILLDLDLPGVDGFQIARLIRQREADDQRTPLIAITARAGGDEEYRSLQSGMDGFLRKPLTGEQLGQILAEIVPRVAGMTAETVTADPP